MIQLHYFPGNASMTPHLLLRELGLDFELAYVDRAAGAHKRVDYLALNPNGLIPVLVDGELVLYETAAIVLHLVDCHPAAGLAPPPGSVERAEFYKWLLWMSSTVQATMPLYFYSDRFVLPGNAAGAAEVFDGSAVELAADFFANQGTTGQNGDVLEHGFAAIAEARSLDGQHVDGAAELVDYQGCQGFAVDIF